MYFHDPSTYVYQMTLLGFAMFPFYAPFSTFIVGMRDLWRCMDHKYAVNFIVAADGIIVVIAMSYVLSYFFGMTGIWIAQVGGCALLAFIIWLMAWIMGKKLPVSVPDLCCYPADFGVADDMRLNLTVHGMDEVINISKQVIDFCKARGVENITSQRAGLCVEELAGNIVAHGFSGKKGEAVDISVTKSKEELIIKFKDNCRLFNPKELDAIFDPEDPVRNIGIRLVSKSCREMEYHSLLGLNVMSITM
jgi:anti-sigma regulatory factor (Ser/Thr protein kinase)